jgi:hypothetical protein
MTIWIRYEIHHAGVVCLHPELDINSSEIILEDPVSASIPAVQSPAALFLQILIHVEGTTSLDRQAMHDAS